MKIAQRSPCSGLTCLKITYLKQCGHWGWIHVSLLLVPFLAALYAICSVGFSLSPRHIGSSMIAAGQIKTGGGALVRLRVWDHSFAVVTCRLVCRGRHWVRRPVCTQDRPELDQFKG